MKSMPAHRMIVVIWHTLVLAMLIFTFFAWRDSGEIHWLWIPLFLTPLLALGVTFAAISSRSRSLVYWLLAVISIPTAASGLTSIVGWMFIVSIVMLIWAGRRENPADEMVQM